MSKIQVTCHNIKWDIDEEDVEYGVHLPSTVVLECDSSVVNEEDVSEIIGDLLSDKIGWCHTGFQYTVGN